MENKIKNDLEDNCLKTQNTSERLKSFYKDFDNNKKKKNKKEENNLYKIPYIDNTCFCVFICIVNIIIPGLGTFLMGLCLPGQGAEEEQMCLLRCVICFLGILQLLLSIWIIGWVLSILTGFLLLKANCEYRFKERLQTSY